MEGQKKVKRKKEPRSRDPYRRRQESEMLEIARQIRSGAFSIRGACLKYGLSRNTLKKWLLRISVRSLDDNLSQEIFAEMNEKKQVAALLYLTVEKPTKFQFKSIPPSVGNNPVSLHPKRDDKTCWTWKSITRSYYYILERV